MKGHNRRTCPERSKGLQYECKSCENPLNLDISTACDACKEITCRTCHEIYHTDCSKKSTFVAFDYCSDCRSEEEWHSCSECGNAKFCKYCRCKCDPRSRHYVEDEDYDYDDDDDDDDDDDGDKVIWKTDDILF